jgi:hypothetical protein
VSNTISGNVTAAHYYGTMFGTLTSVGNSGIASSDGFIIVFVNSGTTVPSTGNATVTDTTTSTVLGGACVYYGTPSGDAIYLQYASCTVPIKSGHSWSVSETNTRGSVVFGIYWMPLGG